jgi:ferredoxin-NADP reductase/mono/diheme cytochrome c family protein
MQILTNSASLWLGVTFVLIGALNVWLILQASARVRDGKASARLIAAHRIGGYLFIALFCVMAYFMIARMETVAGAASGAMIHLTLAMILTPLLFVKVLIARYYKNHYAFLMPIGLMIFVFAFVLIAITAGPYLARSVRMQHVSLEATDLAPAVIDIDRAAATMEKRCSKCHNLDRVVGAHKDSRGWVAAVNRMRALPDSGISEEDARIIALYLASRMTSKSPDAAASLEVARALVDQRCGRCHGLDRVYKTAETPEEWSATVTRMVSYAAGSAGAFQPGEDQQIIAYLSATQTPDAVNRRIAEAAAASSAGRSLVTREAAAPDRPTPSHGYDGKMIGFISLTCLSALALIIRRPARAVSVIRAPDSPPAAPLVLKLARITQQTPDAKTLRFIVPDDRKLSARPGQFLTFSFLFDGKKVIRSYSICSSPSRASYVEITAKRVSNGSVSVFLNDRAFLGMTIEAKGAFGHFYFDPSKHKNVVLLAAGSGITPMMAMLHYMDDLCLETTATLLYCVRTSQDIMFHRELEELRSRLRSFQYHVLLSQPHPEWTGPRGHVSREFIEDAVKDLELPDFFLCGPPSFMDASRGILIGLGVKADRIRQESFGGPVLQSAKQGSVEAGAGVVVEFVRSGRTCTVRSAQTLLQAAEEQGVSIPYSCRQGQCGTCKTKLLAGNVRMDAEQGLDPDSKAQGFVLTCVGHADGAVKLDA